MKYRREIDGLRAVAVLPVILFHAGFAAFSGGYVGVDIFFVISGYLITTIILAEKEHGTFSLVKFYERRARRILPVLFFVMFCCLIVAWLWLIPYELENFSQSLVAVSAFSSNLFFWLRSGYFSSASELKPLLHTWSLAVEEQYYLLFPLFLMLLWRLRKRWIFGSLVVIAIASLGWAQWGAYSQPIANFYLLPSRAWELAIGALIAFYLLYRSDSAAALTKNPRLNDACSLLGGVLIVWSICWFDKSTPFPSFYALLPTVGTGLLILFAKPETLVGRFLGTRIMVGIGLISYSTYLWHQPLFAFARQRTLADPSVTLLLVLSALSILLAYFSWRYIEIPCRNKDIFSQKKIFLLAALGSCGFAAVGLAGHVSHGFETRVATASLPQDYYSKTLIPTFNTGLDGKKCTSEQASLCHFYQGAADKNYLLVGDSHSADYSAAFASYVKEQNASGWQMSVTSCGMLQGQIVGNVGECRKAIRILKQTLTENHYSKIFFVANLYGYTKNLKPQEQTAGVESFVEVVKDMSAEARRVVVFAPRYALDTPNPVRYAIAQAANRIKLARDDNNQQRWDDAIRTLPSLANVTVFDQGDEIVRAGCGRADCFNGHDLRMNPLYRDATHLTRYGAQLIWQKFQSDYDDPLDPNQHALSREKTN